MKELSHPEDAAGQWKSLRSFTDARIALGRTGNSVPLKESLHFKLAHAHARDAVYSTLSLSELTKSLAKFNLPITPLQSQINSRQEYLQRPDLGKRLNKSSADQLTSLSSPASDVAIILTDGLSAKAIHDHAFHLLDLLIPQLQSSKLQLAPLTIVEQGRVAIGDEVGFLLQAKLSLILIGERPGLSSPNSLGAYITYHPAIGLTDDSRNCVSNIRPEGLSYSVASQKIFYLISESLRRKVAGVHLKDESGLIS